MADLITVFAVTDPDADRHHRLSCFVVEVPTDGFAVTRIEHKMGLRGSPTAELAFDGVRVPAANRIGEEGDGFGARDADVRAQPAGDRGPGRRHRPGRARGRDRVRAGPRQFGQRVGDFQMVAAMLADMDAATEAARQLLYKACVEIEAGPRTPAAGRRCVNSWPGMPRCVSPPTPSILT